MTIRPLKADQIIILKEFKRHFEELRTDLCRNNGIDTLESDIGTISAYNEIINLIDDFLNQKVKSCNECPDNYHCINANTPVSVHCNMIEGAVND